VGRLAVVLVAVAVILHRTVVAPAGARAADGAGSASAASRTSGTAAISVWTRPFVSAHQVRGASLPASIEANGALGTMRSGLAYPTLAHKHLLDRSDRGGG
jgi:hypothetical protein